MSHFRDRELVDFLRGAMLDMYDLAASLAEIELPPVSVSPSGSLKLSRRVEEAGKLSRRDTSSESEASSRP